MKALFRASVLAMGLSVGAAGTAQAAEIQFNGTNVEHGETWAEFYLVGENGPIGIGRNSYNVRCYELIQEGPQVLSDFMGVVFEGVYPIQALQPSIEKAAAQAIDYCEPKVP